MKAKDIIGEVYGRLTVVGDAPRTNANRRVFVLCVCGQTKDVLLGSLRSGATTSCGCFLKEVVTTHGQSRSGNKLYRVWAAMKNRCADPDHINYGDRGITVCSEWLSFEKFEMWANNSGYKPGLSIDRIKNDEGYSPNNCRWTNSTTQSRNRRSAKGSSSKYVGVHKCTTTNKWVAMITVDGKKKNLGLHASELDAAVTRERFIKNNQLQNFTLNNV